MPERLLAEYDALEDRIELDSMASTWALADWLAANVEHRPGARTDLEPEGSRLTMGDLAGRRGRTVQHLSRLRRVAAVTAENRMPDVTIWGYRRALERHDWQLNLANAALRLTEGEAIAERAARRAEERLRVAAEVLASEDPAVVARMVDELPEPRRGLICDPPPIYVDPGPTEATQATGDLAQRFAGRSQRHHRHWILMYDDPKAEEEFDAMLASLKRCWNMTHTNDVIFQAVRIAVDLETLPQADEAAA